MLSLSLSACGHVKGGYRIAWTFDGLVTELSAPFRYRGWHGCSVVTFGTGKILKIVL